MERTPSIMDVELPEALVLFESERRPPDVKLGYDAVEVPLGVKGVAFGFKLELLDELVGDAEVDGDEVLSLLLEGVMEGTLEELDATPGVDVAAGSASLEKEVVAEEASEIAEEAAEAVKSAISINSAINDSRA